jgi:Flp pilus assembly protein TadG
MNRAANRGAGLRPVRDERGSAAVEIVLVAPLLVALLLFVAGLGRMATARGQVEGAAREAARAASLERSLPAAASAGQAAARATLAGEDITCARLAVAVDVTSYRPGGRVTARVECTASMAGLGMAGFPGHRSFTATSVAPIERWRGQ